MQTLSALIIDDDIACLQQHSKILQDYCPEITHIQTACNMQEAIKHIASQTFNLLFLDIELGNENSFQYIDFFNTLPSETSIVILSEYQEYAYKALKLGVLDYIIKPATPDAMMKAVRKYHNRFKENTINMDRFWLLNGHSKTFLLRPNEIVMMAAEGPYTNIFLTTGFLNATKTLGSFSSLYEHPPFVRLSRSEVLNVNHILRIEKEANGAGIVYFTGGHKLAVSKVKKDQLIRHLHGVQNMAM